MRGLFIGLLVIIMISIGIAGLIAFMIIKEKSLPFWWYGFAAYIASLPLLVPACMWWDKYFTTLFSNEQSTTP